MTRFPYAEVPGVGGSLLPRLPLTLQRDNHAINVIGLVDSGSSVNVLPFSVGLKLGAIWELQKPLPGLAGNLSSYEARALLLQGQHPALTGNQTIDLLFAWIKTDQAPVIFGQMNFFLLFEVCFFRAESAFEVRLR